MRSMKWALLLVLVCVTSSALGFKGELMDVTCTAEMINESNRGLRNILNRLVSSSTFFSIFKVNMYKDCPFWPDDGMCTSKESCGVECCGDDDVPVGWRADGESGCVECKDDPKVDRSIPEKELVSFPASDEDVWTIQDDDEHMIYVDLRKNPESYTGYRGDSARRAWTAIYDENCFSFAKNCVGGICQPEACKEERVLFRVISGVHTSITMSIVKEFLYKNGKMDLDMYKKRVGYFPDRIQNLYFLYALSTRALSKAATTLSKFDFTTGDAENDAETASLLEELWSQPSLRPGCLKAFDESDMFLGDSSVKAQFRSAFRNISAIMDCVGCEKCKLWGKVEFLGIGTALKILFDGNVPLQRNEVIALIQTVNKVSTSVHYVQMIENEIDQEEQRTTKDELTLEVEAKPKSDVPLSTTSTTIDLSTSPLPKIAVAFVAFLTLVPILLHFRSTFKSSPPVTVTKPTAHKTRKRAD